MDHFKALMMNGRGTSDDRPPRQPQAAAQLPPVFCRHCGGPRMKLSYRRREKAGDDGAEHTTFILRCADCEGFTTVQA